MAIENISVNSEFRTVDEKIIFENADVLCEELSQALAVTHMLWLQFEPGCDRFNDEILSNATLNIEYRIKAALKAVNNSLADHREIKAEEVAQ